METKIMYIKSRMNLISIEIKTNGELIDRMIYKNIKDDPCISLKKFFSKYYKNSIIVMNNSKQNISLIIDLLKNEDLLSAKIEKSDREIKITICTQDMTVINKNYSYCENILYYFKGCLND